MFETKNIVKYCTVRDHCHYIGEFRGATYSICNTKYGVLK